MVIILVICNVIDIPHQVIDFWFVLTSDHHVAWFIEVTAYTAIHKVISLLCQNIVHAENILIIISAVKAVDSVSFCRAF